MGVVTTENRDKLLKNKNVERLTSSHIVYRVSFQKKALKSYENGCSVTEIWGKAGFDQIQFKPGYLNKLIQRWKVQSLKPESGEKRGRKKGAKFSSDKEELEFLRAENIFLKELQALEIIN